MNTEQLIRILSSDVYTRHSFLSVFPSDQLPRRIVEFPACFVVNVDPSTKPGSHWVAFYCETPDRVEFFDSYGNAPTYFEGGIIQFASQFPRVNFNAMTLQSRSTAVCGQYCVYYLYSRCRGESLNRILLHFTTQNLCNDQRVYQFVCRRFRTCVNFYQ